MKLRYVREVTTIALCLFLTTGGFAAETKDEPVPCAGKSTTCRETSVTETDTEKKTCERCETQLCKPGGDQNSWVRNKIDDICTTETKGLVAGTDDGSTFDFVTEMAPDVGGSGQGDADTITAPNNFTSALVVSPAEACSAANASTCDSHGASCDVIHDRGGNTKEVCRWSSRNSESACKRTAGIWTSTSSKYAKNHPDAIKSGGKGACITDVKNIVGKKAPQRTDNRKSGERTDHRTTEKRTDRREAGLAAPSDLSVIDVSSTALTLVWHDNSDSEFGVELYRIDPVAARSGQGADWEFIGLFEERIDSNVKGTGPRSNEDYDLSPDTRYCYRMRTYSGFDRLIVSDYSDSVCTKTLTTGSTRNDR